jgi:DNA mismatch endonuclease (patch repair protein)
VRREGWSPPAGSWASSLTSRRSMVANRGRDTKPELALRSVLHRMGLRFRVDVRPLQGVPRRADIVFRRARVAVFVNGCFWHGCKDHGTWPKKNSDWWREKIERNRRRDWETDRLLQSAGWKAVRVWEHDDLRVAAETIARIVRKRS